MRRFVFLFVLVSALTLIATVTGSSSGTKVPAVVGAGTITGCISPGPCTLPAARFAVSAAQGGGEYAFSGGGTDANGNFVAGIELGQVQCVFRSVDSAGVDFAAVGGNFTANVGGGLVGHPFVVYFSAQTATRPDIDPALPADFPKKCPSQAPSNATFYPLLSGSITYAP